MSVSPRPGPLLGPPPASQPVTAKTPEERVEVALAGRREAALLAEPSVARMAHLLARRCREIIWIRQSVVTLDRFRALVAPDGLEPLLARARHDASEADAAIATFADRLPACTDTQWSTLAHGPKVWYRSAGVPVSWRSGVVRPTSLTRQSALGNDTATDPARIMLLAMIGSGLSVEELLTLRIGDVGSLDADGRLVPDLHADPLAVSYTPLTEGERSEDKITFLNHEARTALAESWAQRVLTGAALGPDAPLIAAPDGSVGTGAVQRARARHASLIEAGNEVNVFMCRMTGDFFREWGMPGAAFLARAAESDSQPAG